MPFSPFCMVHLCIGASAHCSSAHSPCSMPCPLSLVPCPLSPVTCPVSLRTGLYFSDARNVAVRRGCARRHRWRSWTISPGERPDCPVIAVGVTERRDRGHVEFLHVDAARAACRIREPRQHQPCG